MGGGHAGPPPLPSILPFARDAAFAFVLMFLILERAPPTDYSAARRLVVEVSCAA